MAQEAVVAKMDYNHDWRRDCRRDPRATVGLKLLVHAASHHSVVHRSCLFGLPPYPCTNGMLLPAGGVPRDARRVPPHRYCLARAPDGIHSHVPCSHRQ